MNRPLTTIRSTGHDPWIRILTGPIADACLLGTLSVAQAASDSWNVDAAGSWATGTNLLGGAAPGAMSGTSNTDIATFGFVPGGPNAPRGLHFSNNLLSPGTEGIANIKLPP